MTFCKVWDTAGMPRLCLTTVERFYRVQVQLSSFNFFEKHIPALFIDFFESGGGSKFCPSSRSGTGLLFQLSRAPKKGGLHLNFTLIFSFLRLFNPGLPLVLRATQSQDSQPGFSK